MEWPVIIVIVIVLLALCDPGYRSSQEPDLGRCALSGRKRLTKDEQDAADHRWKSKPTKPQIDVVEDRISKIMTTASEGTLDAVKALAELNREQARKLDAVTRAVHGRSHELRYKISAIVEGKT